MRINTCFGVFLKLLSRDKAKTYCKFILKWASNNNFGCHSVFANSQKRILDTKSRCICTDNLSVTMLGLDISSLARVQTVALGIVARAELSDA